MIGISVTLGAAHARGMYADPSGLGSLATTAWYPFEAGALERLDGECRRLRPLLAARIVVLAVWGLFYGRTTEVAVSHRHVRRYRPRERGTCVI